MDHYTSDVSAILGAMAPGSYRLALGKCSPSIYRQTHTEERVSRPSDFGFTSCWLLDLHIAGPVLQLAFKACKGLY